MKTKTLPKLIFQMLNMWRCVCDNNLVLFDLEAFLYAILIAWAVCDQSELYFRVDVLYVAQSIELVSGMSQFHF